LFSSRTNFYFITIIELRELAGKVFAYSNNPALCAKLLPDNGDPLEELSIGPLDIKCVPNEAWKAYPHLQSKYFFSRNFVVYKSTSVHHPYHLTLVDAGEYMHIYYNIS
jgi:hypothetical protein